MKKNVRYRTGIIFVNKVLVLFVKYLCFMIQQIILLIIFMIALFYLGRIVYRSFKLKEGAGCETNCKCESTTINKKVQDKLLG